MSDVLADRDLFLNYTYNREHTIYSNFPIFYATIGILSVLGGILFIFNIACCWCSRHRHYWRDRHTDISRATGDREILVDTFFVAEKTPHKKGLLQIFSTPTGNRWIQSLWVVTPHKSPPLDISELKPGIVHTVYPAQGIYSSQRYPTQGSYYPESEADDLEAQYDSRLGTPQPQEYMELHKRESEI